MSILVVTHVNCNGKDYESRRKVEITDNIPIAEIARFFWPRISPNFLCKSVRHFDSDLEEFVDIENPEAEAAIPKQKYEFRYAEFDGTGNSVISNVFNCRAEAGMGGIAFFLQKTDGHHGFPAGLGHAKSFLKKEETKQSPYANVDLPSTSTGNQSPEQQYSPPLQQIGEGIVVDTKPQVIEITTNSSSPVNEDPEVEKFTGELQDFFNQYGIFGSVSESMQDESSLDNSTQLPPSDVPELDNIVIPNAVEHLQTQVDRGDFALGELRKYADGEINFFHEQVKRVITLAIGDYLLENYFDTCTAPVRRYFCQRYLAQLPGNLRPEIFSNSKTVGTVDCYIKNKKKRLRKLSRMAEQGLASTTAPPPKKTKIEPIPERPKAPKFVDEMRITDMDSSSEELQILYKKSYTYRQNLINYLNKVPDVDPIDEIAYEFPHITKVPQLLEQDFEMCTSRLRQNVVTFETEWEENFAPIVAKYFDSVCPAKYVAIDRLYRDVIDRESLQAFVMVFSLLEYNALTLAQIKTMIIEHAEAPLENVIEDIRITRKIPEPVILASPIGYRIVIGRHALPLTQSYLDDLNMSESNVNALVVKTKGKAYMYDVLLEILTGDKVFVINKNKIDLHEKMNCRTLVHLAYEGTQCFGDPKLVYGYDGSSILYTNVPIGGIEYTVEQWKFTNELAKAYRHDISVKITPTTTHHVIDLNKKVETMNVDELNEFKRFISIVICQDAINRGAYSTLDQSSLFSMEKARMVRNGVEFRTGFSKGVNLVKNGDEVKTAFIIDARTCAFYKSQDVFSTANEVGIKNAVRFLQGVTVFPSYNAHRRLYFTGFTDTTAATEKFSNEKEGKEMSVFEYFKQMKKINVNPNIPLATVRPRQAGTFPSEKLIILPYQRVALERLDQRLVDELHRANAVPPNERYRSISNIITDLCLGNPIMKAFGLEARPEFVRVPLRPIHRPNIQLGGSVAQPRDDGLFRDPRARYIVPATIKNWVVLYSNKADRNIINKLIKNLMDKGKYKGMTITPPVDVVQVDMGTLVQNTYPKCGEYGKNGVRFILVIDPKDTRETHKAVKLIECRYRIVTQQLSYQLVFDCVTKNQNMTLENILNKMNLKNGGCNYAPKFEHGAESLALNKGTFVVGYQARHSKIVPQRVSTENIAVREPSAIGFSANYANNPNLFVGNFLFQVDPRSDVDFELADPRVLEDQMTHMLKLLANNRKNEPKPHTIVILRDGVSEYQHEILISQELPALRRGCQKIDPNWKPKFIYMVTTKEHNTRLFERNGNRVNNPLPGTFVAETAVYKGKEFIMTPHKALNGTSRPVKVTILVNESNVGLEGLQSFIHALSYSHQLTCSPTALPEPIYQSGILSQRAHAVLSAMKEYFPNAVPREQFQYDIPKLNARLSFRDTFFEHIRFSA